MRRYWNFIYEPKLVAVERAVFWILLWAGTALIFLASRSYFFGSEPHEFLIERPHLTMHSWWRYSLYVHVISGCLCLASSLLQYSKIFLKRYVKVHKSLGYVYVLSLLIAVIPTGLILSNVAKGGWISQVGFHAMNVSVLVCVILGMRAIFQKRVQEHQAWMTRSFALITSAITFRTLQVIFHQFHVPYEIVYPTCVWLSIIVNVWVAEYYLYKSKTNTNKTI